MLKSIEFNKNKLIGRFIARLRNIFYKNKMKRDTWHWWYRQVGWWWDKGSLTEDVTVGGTWVSPWCHLVTNLHLSIMPLILCHLYTVPSQSSQCPLKDTCWYILVLTYMLRGATTLTAKSVFQKNQNDMLQ